MKREDSFEVIEGEDHSSTPEEYSSNNDLEVSVNGKRMESSAFFVESSYEKENANLITDNENPALKNGELVESSEEARTVDLPKSPKPSADTTATLGPIQPFEFNLPALCTDSHALPGHDSESVRQTVPRENRLTRTGILESNNLTRWYFPIIFVLSGIILAQFVANRGDSIKIAQLRSDLIALKADYTIGFRRQSYEPSPTVSDLKAQIAEMDAERIQLVQRAELYETRERELQRTVEKLQSERTKLLDEIRENTAQHETNVHELQRLIVDLQAERKKLMDALMETEKQMQLKEESVSHLQLENTRLKALLKRQADGAELYETKERELQRTVEKLQSERTKLLDEIRENTAQHETNVHELQRLIVDLQAERKKLMDDRSVSDADMPANIKHRRNFRKKHKRSELHFF